ncbi:HAD family hydrolase [Photobacterium sanctipauli]|nr:HAD family phosphatase [Photobacterium sanctipauli]
MIELIIFDLGGVVIELGKEPLPNEWIEDRTQFTLKEWFKSDTALLFEKGEISAEEFAKQVKQELGLTVSHDEIKSAFAKWPIGMYPMMPSILQSLREKYKLVVLTNTNELHYPRLMDEFELEAYFDQIFASHLIHLAKPDPKIYQYVLSKLKIEAEKVLFIDDNIDNINAAKSVGIFGIHACGEQEVYEGLLEYGIELPPST